MSWQAAVVAAEVVLVVITGLMVISIGVVAFATWLDRAREARGFRRWRRQLARDGEGAAVP